MSKQRSWMAGTSYVLALGYLLSMITFWAQLDPCQQRTSLTILVTLLVKLQNCLYVCTFMPFFGRRVNSNLELSLVMSIVFTMNSSDLVCSTSALPALDSLTPLIKFQLATHLLFYAVLFSNLMAYTLLLLYGLTLGLNFGLHWLAGGLLRQAKRQIRKYSRVITVLSLDRLSGLSLCTICLETLSGGTVVRLRDCGHLYHEKCLHPWLSQRFNCPNCRVKLETSEEESHLLPVPRLQRALRDSYSGEYQHDYLF